jgi:hypothetical protein
VIAKRLIDLAVPEDAKRQCTRSAECHRENGHQGPCVTLARALVEKAERWIRRRLAS